MHFLLYNLIATKKVVMYSLLSYSLTYIFIKGRYLIMQKNYLSAIIAAFIVSCLSLTIFASYYTSRVGGGTWERGRHDNISRAFSWYTHSGKNHGATAETDLHPGSESRVCEGPGVRAESESEYEKPNSFQPHWHICDQTH